MIKTSRLTLIPLTLEQLQLCLTDLPLLERELGLSLSREMLADPVPRAVGMKLQKMNKSPVDHHPWQTYWLIVVGESGVGLCGFKGYPDEGGETEIGYGIDPAYRRQGYMTETVRAMIDWAFEHPFCRVITAKRVLHENIASQKVLEKVGMQCYEETDSGLNYRIGKEKNVPA